MTEIITDRPNRGINVEKTAEQLPSFEITGLTSRPVPCGWRCSYKQIGENYQAQMSGVFVNEKACGSEAGLADYLKSVL